jgi:hypothetical protein
MINKSTEYFQVIFRKLHVVCMDENELPKRYWGQTQKVNEDVADRNQDGLTR